MTGDTYTGGAGAVPAPVGDMDPAEVSGLELMQRVPMESVWGLLEHAPMVAMQPGDVLLRAGEHNETMYLVLSGELQVCLESGAEPVATLRAGETVGELSVIDRSPVSANVTAAQPTRLVAIDETTFWRLVEASHDFATNLLLILAARVRSTNSSVLHSIRQRRHFEHEALVDGLTGLRNRRWLDQTLPRLVERHARDGSPLAVAMIDVDHFKRYNDSHGHSAGDRVLMAVSRVLATLLRPTDLVSRYGGEEFTALLPQADIEGAHAAAERVRAGVARTTVRTPEGAELPSVTISVGVAQLRAGEDPAALMKRADDALYQAKRLGRNRVEGWNG